MYIDVQHNYLQLLLIRTGLGACRYIFFIHYNCDLDVLLYNDGECVRLQAHKVLSAEP